MNATRAPEEYESSGFFALRTPLLPFDEILAFGEGLEARGQTAHPEQVDAALEADRVVLRARLGELLGRPVVQEAVYLASPSLSAQVDAWKQDPDSARGRDVGHALVRYFLRMAGRATPFGMFSGSSVGRRGSRSAIRLGPAGSRKRHTRLDMHYLCSLLDGLVRADEIRTRLRFRPNSGLYAVAGRLRYPERRMRADGLSYQLVHAEATDYLLATLERAERGASYADLSRGLAASDPEVTSEAAAAYVDELIEAQILVPDLEPAVTGPEPIHGLVRDLAQIGSPVAPVLQRVQRGLETIDARGLGVDPAEYRALSGELEGLPAAVDPARLFQVDVHGGSVQATLGADVFDEILRGATLLSRLVPDVTSDALSRFRRAFGQRYEGRGGIPLVEVLDEDLGVGFDAEPRGGAEAAPLLRGIGLPAQPGSTQVRWTSLQRGLLDRLIEGAQSMSREIALSEQEIEELAEGREPRLPPAFNVLAVVAARDAQALDRGEFRVLMRWGLGPSGARMLGRFCHADPDLCHEVERHLRAEESVRPEAIFAEVVHLPQGRLGNVLLRPVLRSHEIPFLGRSGAPDARQIRVTDLVVSVEGERIVLRSRRLGREVVPRMTTAHNYSFAGANLALYRFLCMLQDQDGTPGIGWEWGPLDSVRFLPRVTCGRLVLHRARWLLGQQEIAELGGSSSASFVAWQRLREKLRFPRFVVLADSDHELPVDLDNVLAVEALSDVIRRRADATLFEMFPTCEELCARGPEGAFVHELIVPFVRKAPQRPEQPPAPQHDSCSALAFAARPAAARRFLPGSEWLYAKLYCGTGVADQVLEDVAAPLARDALASGACDRWFFLRFADPEPHLRLRFHGSADRLSREVLTRLHDLAGPLVADGRIWKVQLDTYEPELARYGGSEGIGPSERLFQADSEAVLALLPFTAGDEGAARRWRLALLAIDLLLEDLAFPRVGSAVLVRQLRDTFAEELGVEKPTRVQLGQRFRDERSSLEALLDRPEAGEPGPLELLRARSKCIAEVGRELRSLAARGLLSGRLEQLAASYIHMHVNRLLRSTQRAQELVLYDFLDRLYTSRAARMRKRSQVAIASRVPGEIPEAVTG